MQQQCFKYKSASGINLCVIFTRKDIHVQNILPWQKFMKGFLVHTKLFYKINVCYMGKNQLKLKIEHNMYMYMYYWSHQHVNTCTRICTLETIQIFH